MDKRVVLWAGLTVLGFVVMTKTQLLNILVAFLILGVIPGTSLFVPSWLIFTVYPLLFVGILLWLGSQSLVSGAEAAKPTRKTAQKRATRTKRVPKRQPRTAI